MEITPPISAAKRSRVTLAKKTPESAARKPIEVKAVEVKAAPEPTPTSKPRAKRKVKEAAPASEASAAAPLDLTPMIATAAYYLAAGRNFAPGYEMEDWLTAERQVLATYGIGASQAA